MNAYKELFSDTVTATDEEFIRNLKELEASVVEVTTDWDKKRNRRKFEITPTIDSNFISNWLSSVKWAIIGAYSLKSKRTRKDEINFLEAIASIDYDDGYGSQQLFGTIVFNDGSWMERREYDGSEWWSFCRCPDEPDWDNLED